MDSPECKSTCTEHRYGDPEDWLCKVCPEECNNCADYDPKHCLDCNADRSMLGLAPNVCVTCPSFCPTDSCHVGLNEFGVH